MSRRTLVVVFVLALPVLLVATLPLRMILATGMGDTFERIDLSAAEASGSAWSGRLHAVEWRGVPQGDVAVSLRPLSLLAGTRRLHLAARGFSVDLLQGRRTGFESADGQLALAIRQPLAGTVQLSMADARLVFADGRCQDAGGAVSAQLAPAVPGPSLQMEGTISCDGDGDGDHGRLALATREPASLPATVDLAIDARGHLELRSLARPANEATSLALQAAGFRPAPDGLGRTDSWRLVD